MEEISELKVNFKAEAALFLFFIIEWTIYFFYLFLTDYRLLLGESFRHK